MVWVLVVDDDAPTREALRLALEDAGYAVLEAADGGQALTTLRRSRRRLVALVDLLMPVANGTDLLRAVAQEPRLARRHRYIAMTAGSQALAQSVADTLAALGGQTLLKPFGIDALLMAVSVASA
jgi:CheY-like chemotaxis protein